MTNSRLLRKDCVTIALGASLRFGHVALVSVLGVLHPGGLFFQQLSGLVYVIIQFIGELNFPVGQLDHPIVHLAYAFQFFRQVGLQFGVFPVLILDAQGHGLLPPAGDICVEF